MTPQIKELSDRAEIEAGERFEFGKNWANFLRRLNHQRIEDSESQLNEFLGIGYLAGKSFLDVGSGSGLSSLAARRLGALVTSFDFDRESVVCTAELRRRFFPDDPSWIIYHGSVLDQTFLCTLGQFDVVYSWGVLHHTGSMWMGMGNVQKLVRPGGRLFIAIYNDAGEESKRWLHIKKTYQRIPSFLRTAYALSVWLPAELRMTASHLLSGKLREYISELISYKGNRGMSRTTDIIDWIGGYPYEFASAKSVIEFYSAAGFSILKLQENSSYGCNQFVFQRSS